MKYQFDECLERGKIVKIPIDPALVEKELREAEADLAAAEQSLLDLQEKWAIIQAYYSIFHSLRSQVFGKGYREKSHRCLKYAVEALLVDQGVLDPVVLEHFSFAMDLREGADYGCIYNAESASIVVMSARTVYEMVRP
ncbi:MAG: HEPN domain-containing protein [Deltaproteobacteria bacterium]